MNYHSWVGNNAHCIPYLNRTMNSLFPQVVQCILHNIIERTHMVNEFGSPNQSEFPCKKYFENLLFIDYRFLETFLCIDLQLFFSEKNYLPIYLNYGILVYFIFLQFLTNDMFTAFLTNSEWPLPFTSPDFCIYSSLIKINRETRQSVKAIIVSWNFKKNASCRRSKMTVRQIFNDKMSAVNFIKYQQCFLLHR